MFPPPTAASALNSAIVRDVLTVSPETPFIVAIALMTGCRTFCPSSDPHPVPQFHDVRVTHPVHWAEAPSSACSCQTELQPQVAQAMAEIGADLPYADLTNIYIDHIYIEARSSCVLVVEPVVDQSPNPLVAQNRVVGIVTERDVVRLLAQGICLEALTVGQVMVSPVVTLHEADFTNLFAAIQLLQTHQIRHLPILDQQDCLLGLVTHETLRCMTQPIDLLRLRSVEQVMHRQVVSASPESSLLALAQLMAERRVSSVVITEPMPLRPASTQSTVENAIAQEATAPRQRPVGIVTERDLVQFQSLGLQLTDYTAATVMSSPVFTVQPQEPLWTVQQMMTQRFIQRIVVTGRDGECLGIVTQSSLLQTFSPVALYELASGLEHKVNTLEAENLALLTARNAELEHQVAQRTLALQTKAERETLVRQIANRIRMSLDMQTVLNVGVGEIREFLACDRVIVYQFQPDWSGRIIAESVTKDWNSALGNVIRDSCFQQQATDLYRNDQPIAVDNIYTAGYAPCHVALLEQYQVKANLVVPIRVADQLWGLLIAHQCRDYHHWRPDDLLLLQDIAVQLAIALQQASTYHQLQSELNERQRTEQALIYSEARYREAQRIAQIGNWELDLQTNTLHWSDQIFQIFELDPQQFTASYEGFLNCVHPDDREFVNTAYLDSLRDRTPYTIVHRLQMPDGRIKYVQEQCETSYADDGTPMVSHGTVQDITKLKQTQLQLEQLNAELEARVAERTVELEAHKTQLQRTNQELLRATRLKDEFLANMSHELRTPLNAILGLTEGLEDQVFGRITQEQRKALNTIERSGSHLLALINDILDVAKIESGQMDLDCNTISVRSLCQSSLTFVKQQAVKKGVHLNLHLPVTLPELWGDERRLRQVLINLLNNAVKFTPEGGRVTLAAEVRPSLLTNPLLNPHSIPADVAQFPTAAYLGGESCLRLSITDTGIGIAPDNIGKLFQPFIQIDSALNRQYDGTGLGLALVKRIVELHGGSVNLTSQVGAGSCFSVDLPCVTTVCLISAKPRQSMRSASVVDRNANAESSKVEPSGADTMPLILLAEDNEANISTVSSYLGAKGYRMVLANNGREAITLTQTHNPDLILMDIQMPEVDGLEAIQTIRALPNYTDTPIIALTALAMDDDRDRCLAAGANEYLAKPVRLKELATTINRLLVA